MSKPTLYIHVGLQKTGTSAIQNFFSINQQDIYKQCNVYYPCTGRAEWFQHFQLFCDPWDSSVWLRLQEEVANFPGADLLLSHEGICGSLGKTLPPEGVKSIQKQFPAYDIKIILYLRRIDTFLQSWYNEVLKNSKVESTFSWSIPCTYKDWIKMLCDSGREPFVFQSQLVTLFENLVGKENLLVGIYDRNYMNNGDIISDFFEILGKRRPDVPLLTRDPNPSLPSALLSFMPTNILTDIHHPAMETIGKKIIRAFEFTTGGNIPSEWLPKLEEEIDLIDERVPGYKELFAKQPLSMDWPELNVDWKQVLGFDLLYTLYERTHRQQLEVADLRMVIEKILGEQQALRKTNEQILGEQQALRKTNEQILGEQQVLRETNEQILGELRSLRVRSERSFFQRFFSIKQ